MTPPVRQMTLPETASPPASARPGLRRQRSLEAAAPMRPARVSAASVASLQTAGAGLVTTNRRLVLALDQFTSAALPFYLELVSRYTNKIQRVMRAK